MHTAQEKESLYALLLHAALADGGKSEAERSALRAMAQSLAQEETAHWTIYQAVLSGGRTVEQAAAALTTRESRLLAYEMAVGVCDTDGPPNANEQRFLERLREALRLDSGAGEVLGVEQQAAGVLAALPVPASAGEVPLPLRSSPVDTEALDRRILNYAILTGALELLPQSLATLAVVPLQMKMVYSIGKEHGYTLDRGHIRDFMATAGAGLAAQAVEGYARKLLGGVMGGLLGGGLLGGLGRAAVGTGAGAAITFAATYAIGQLSVRYYGGGRKMELAVLKDTFATLQDRGRALFTQHRSAVEQRASTLTPSEVMNLVRQ